MVIFGWCGGGPRARPLGADTAKVTNPHLGGCGKACHEGKVLGQIQKGFQEPEDAEL